MTVMISGASKGIGFAIAKRFLAASTPTKLALFSRNKDKIMEATEQLKYEFPNSTILSESCDVSDEMSVREFADKAERTFGPVDVLVNNAGYGVFKPVEAFSDDEFDGIIRTNLRGVFLLTRSVLPMMRKRKTGTIITIDSLAGKNGFVGGGAYCASKFGVRGLMQSLFLEVREDNVRVVTIFPGSVATDFFHNRETESMRSPQPLTAVDVAECAFFAASLPASATVSEIDVRPTNPKGK